MANKTCDCNDDAGQHPSPLVRTMARSASTVVSGRVTNATAKALLGYCSTNACSQSEALRKALVILSAADDDPQKKLDAIATAIGLDPANTPPEDILAAVQEIVSAATASPDEASAEAPDPVPPKPGAVMPALPKPNPTPPASLSISRFEIAECAKAGMPISEYLAARNRIARGSSALVTEAAEPAPIQLSAETKAILKAQGRSEADFRKACATAVKRV